MIRFRSRRALGGGAAPIAFSTARIEAMACTVVQTPQIRWANAHASRGSRPFRISSIPRNIVDEDQASRTAPPSTSASIRRCPSMRVTGSTTTRAITHLLSSASLA
jgi:hypothetical protein